MPLINYLSTSRFRLIDSRARDSVREKKNVKQDELQQQQQLQPIWTRCEISSIYNNYTIFTLVVMEIMKMFVWFFLLLKRHQIEYVCRGKEIWIFFHTFFR